MRAIILKFSYKNIIHSDDSNDSDDFNGKISTKEIGMKKLKCINLYIKNKRIARSIRNICFPGFASSLLKYKSFLSLRLEGSVSQKIRYFFFFEPGKFYFPKYKKFF